MSYSPADYFLPGWTAAFVYDTPEGAAAAIRLIEYANTQLLEFRYYDEVLTRLLASVYSTLDRGTGFFRRWHLAREAARLNTIRLDVRELTERVDNSIKFLGDMYSARFYRLTAAKVGVPDYRKLVDDKLRAAQDLYGFMMDQFHQGRAFVLELMVVIILLIELFYFFKGKGVIIRPFTPGGRLKRQVSCYVGGCVTKSLALLLLSAGFAVLAEPPGSIRRYPAGPAARGPDQVRHGSCEARRGSAADRPGRPAGAGPGGSWQQRGIASPTRRNCC